MQLHKTLFLLELAAQHGCRYNAWIWLSYKYTLAQGLTCLTVA